MKETLILLTSNFPYGKGETFLETELPYLASNFSRIIIIPTKESNTTNVRSISENCSINNSIVLKKNQESRFQRFFSKIWGSLTFSLFYKELAGLFPNRINYPILDELLTYSRDAILIKKILTNIIHTEQITQESVIIYSYWCYGIALGATLVKPKLTVISRAHGADLHEELYPKNYIPFRKLTFSRIKALFPISTYGVEYLSEKYPTFKEKFQLSRLGIPIPKCPDAFYKKEGNSCLIVSCSSIYNNKRIDSIAKSLKNFAEANPKLNLFWHHFGSGEMLNELRNEINELPKNMEAIFHGHISNKDLLAWYNNNQVDLFINLSKSEGIPVSIMEANSFGIPALATDVGGTSELVTKKSGWLVNKNFSDDEVMDALEEATKNVPLRMQKSYEAKNICATLFDSEKNYTEFVEKLNSL